MRVGRKFSMSEELRAKGKAIEKYLMEPIECKKVLWIKDIFRKWIT